MIPRILTALVLIPLVLLLILRAPGWAVAIVAGIVALLAIREFLELTRQYGGEPFLIPTYILTGIFFALVTSVEVSSLHAEPADLSLSIFVLFSGVLAGFVPFVFLVLGLRRENLSSIYPAAAASVFAFSYIAIPMVLLVSLRHRPMGAFNVIYLMLVVWSGDIFAYFVGKSIGRFKMSPRISPKKTWEGAAASLVASVVFGTAFYNYSLPISEWLLRVHLLRNNALWNQQGAGMWNVILLSAGLNVAAQFGDLVESAIKRGADVKDSGAILPGHGGMLDRIDAMLFAVPVLWLYLAWKIW